MKLTQLMKPRRANTQCSATHSSLGASFLCLRQTLLIDHHTISPHPDPTLPQSPSPPQFMQGPGLAFVAFSQAVSLLPCASFWAIVFFLTLLITELSTLIKIVESIVFPLQNSISITRNHPILLPGTVGSHSSTNPALLLFPPQAAPISRACFDP